MEGLQHSSIEAETAAHRHHDHVIGRIKAMLVQGIHIRPGGVCACRFDCRPDAARPESPVRGGRL